MLDNATVHVATVLYVVHAGNAGRSSLTKTSSPDKDKGKGCIDQIAGAGGAAFVCPLSYPFSHTVRSMYYTTDPDTVPIPCCTPMLN
jgi:hypothetical protein